MGLGHEKLDVYCSAIEYADRAYRFCESLKGHRNAKQGSIPIPMPTPKDNHDRQPLPGGDA